MYNLETIFVYDNCSSCGDYYADILEKNIYWWPLLTDDARSV